MSERGAIHSPWRAKQLHDMRDLKWGKITPTDLDGLIDYHGDRFAFMEFKIEGAEMGMGQRLALTRVVDLIGTTGKRAALFVATHTVRDPDKQVDAARTEVRWIYEARTLRSYYEPTMLRTALDHFFGLLPEPDMAVLDDPAAIAEVFSYREGRRAS